MENPRSLNIFENTLIFIIFNGRLVVSYPFWSAEQSELLVFDHELVFLKLLYLVFLSNTTFPVQFRNYFK